LLKPQENADFAWNTSTDDRTPKVAEGVKKVAVIVPTLNSWEMLRNCLSSLKKTDFGWYKVVVVDNGSSDGTSNNLRREFPWVDVVVLQFNAGFSGGVNSGLKYALGLYNFDYAIILSNDTIITDGDWLGRMVSVAERDPAIGVVNCRYLRPDGQPQPAGIRILPGIYLDALLGMSLVGRNTEQSTSVHETDSAGGACFLIRRSLIDTIGMLDEGYSPAYFEDVDFGLRARKAGFKLVHDGEVSIIHMGAVTSRRFPNPYMAYVYRRNLIRFVGKNYRVALPLLVPALIVGAVIRAVVLGARLDSKAVGFELRQDVGNTIRGLMAFFHRS